MCGPGSRRIVSITLCSLYTVFNPDFLTTNGITCIVNIAGCLAPHGAAGYYQSDCERHPELMAPVQKLCGSNIKKLLDEGAEGIKQAYKETYGIDWLAIEGAVDSWYYKIGQHFAEVNEFLEKHLHENKGTRRANILVSCYGGYNRSASIAVAFLLNRFPGESLEELLCSVCPKRPRMLLKVSWPNQVQSNFLRQLIDYEKTLRQSDTRRFSSGLHCANSEGSTIFDSGFEAAQNPTLRLER